MTELFPTEYFSAFDLLLLGLALILINILIIGLLVGFVPERFINVGVVSCIVLAGVPIMRASTREWKEQTASDTDNNSRQ